MCTVSPTRLLLLGVMLLMLPGTSAARHATAALEKDAASSDPFARVQFIHNLPDAGTIDVYVNDARWLDDLAYREATPFEFIPGGTKKIDIVAADAPDNSAPLWTVEARLRHEVRYVVVAQGRLAEAKLVIRRNVREVSLTGKAEFVVIHGSPDTGPLDIRLRDPAKSNVIVDLAQNNIAFGESSDYVIVPPAEYNFEVTSADNAVHFDTYNFNLTAFEGRAFLILSSGLGTTVAEGFSLIGYDEAGRRIASSITTATDEAAEAPEAFALWPNYPNPFNPATQIPYTLRQRAAVRLVVYDVLGRPVRTLVAAEQPAGAYTVAWDGRSDAGTPVAGGVYLYRLDAAAATQTRAMLLVK